MLVASGIGVKDGDHLPVPERGPTIQEQLQGKKQRVRENMASPIDHVVEMWNTPYVQPVIKYETLPNQALF